MSRHSTVKPADRLFFIVALAALGIGLLIRLRPQPEPEEILPPEPLRLVIGVAEASGFTARDLEPLMIGAGPDIDIGAAEEQADILVVNERLLAAGIGAGRYLPLNRQPGPPSAAGPWALPLVSAMDVLIYNIPLLKEAGLDRPPRTQSDVLRYARAVKAINPDGPAAGGTGRYGLALGLSARDIRGLNRDIYPWFRSAGLPLAQEGRLRFDNRRHTETLDFFFRLNQEGLIAPGSFNTTGADRVEDFTRGTVAMLIVSSRELRGIREKMGNAAVGVTLIPQADGYTGKPVLGLSTWYAAIGADSPHPDEARALLRRLGERRPLLAEALALVPGTGSYEPYIALDPLLDKAWGMYEAAEHVPEFLELPDPPAGVLAAEEPETVFRRELEPMFRRESPRSPEDTAQAIHRSFEQRNGPEYR
jgi:multiple sugar transport system substrate-binding protein